MAWQEPSNDFRNFLMVVLGINNTFYACLGVPQWFIKGHKNLGKRASNRLITRKHSKIVSNMVLEKIFAQRKSAKKMRLDGTMGLIK